MATIYTKSRGNLEQIARVCGASLSLLEKHKPIDELDFAKKLLEGYYSGDNAKIGIGLFREKLRENIARQGSLLKRTTTKEFQGPSKEDIDIVIAFYDKYDGDLDEIAEVLKIDPEVLWAKEPEDEEDFARKFLAGSYARDESAQAQANLRDSLEGDLGEAKGKLRRTETREGMYEIKAEDLAMVKKAYESANNGNLPDLARIFGIDINTLDKHKPQDAEDFAKKLFAGAYSTEGNEGAKAMLRNNLAKTLQKQQSLLRRADTVVRTGEAAEEDIVAVARVYEKHKGHPDKLAATFKISAQLLKTRPPASAMEFGRKLLGGEYTGERSALAKAVLRDNLREDIQIAAGGLRRTTTREARGVGEEDIKVCELIYRNHAGDYAKIAQELERLNVSEALLEKFAPQNAREFAKELLDGAYSVDKGESAKASLRKQLKNGLDGQTGRLKRTQTKEASGEPSPDEIRFLAELFARKNEDLEELARDTGTNVDLMRKSPPEDAEDWARKLLNGTYTTDKSEGAKADLRKALVASVGKARSGLKRTTTKEMVGEASEDELMAFGKIYNNERGNLEKLAKLFGANLQLIRQNLPIDARDFAKKLLSGFYTGEKTKVEKQNLRTRLLEGVQTQAKNLKRTITKEMEGPSKETLEAVALIYDSFRGDFSTLAAHYGISEAILKKDPPETSLDFAERLLQGVYSEEENEAAKAKLRDQLKVDLKRQSSRLKRTTTKEYQGPSNEEIDFMANLYKQYSGNLEQLAKMTGVSLKLMQASPPVDGADWGYKILDGNYSIDKSEQAKKDLRDKLSWELKMQASKLKRTNTKEMTGDATEQDIQNFSAMYSKHRGDLDKLSRLFGTSPSLMKKHPPVDARDFAKKLLEGFFTGDASMIAKTQLRNRLKDELVRQGSTLKRTTTKEFTGPTDEDIAAARKLYNDLKGDLTAIAEKLGVPVGIMQKADPGSDEEFARALLQGQYTPDKSESAKAAMRTRLQKDLVRKASNLKRTSTKEYGGPTPEEIDFIAKIYDNQGGDIDTLAKMFSITAKLIKASPPQDSVEFARKVLDGTYTTDKSETAKKELRDKLSWELRAQGSKLKRTVTKEMDGSALKEDIEVFAKVYSDQRGNVEKLIKAFGINEMLIRGNPPTSPEDFAKKLLEGFYSGEHLGSVERSALRHRLKDDLVRQSSTLRRTKTKLYEGHDPEDIKAAEKLWNDYSGDLDKIAKVVGVNAEVMKTKKTTTATEFAHNLLGGVFSQDAGEAARALFRQKLRQDIHRTASQLKRSNTKEYTGEDKKADTMHEMDFMIKLYNDTKGDLDKLGKALGIEKKAFDLKPPSDARDFARKLLDGAYMVDGSELAKKEMREGLMEGVQVAMAGLKRTNTKEGTGEALTEDIQAISKMYQQERGNLDKLCKIFRVSPILVHKNAPEDADDFAKKLLNGTYTGETSDVARMELRKHFAESLKRKASILKRANTKEYTGPTADELTAAAKIFDANTGDLLKIAKYCDINYDTLVKLAPQDNLQFAKDLLAGKYTTDKDEVAKAQLRKQLQGDLQRTASQLRRANTKQYEGPTQQEIDYLARMYDNVDGNLKSLANMTGCTLKLLNKNKPENGRDFALKLLNGTFTTDKTESAKKEMREKMQWEIKTASKHLKRTTTKEGDGKPTEEDIEAIAKVWNTNRGNLEKIAAVTGASLHLLQNKKPQDGHVFAKKLLEGAYSGTAGDLALKELRARLREDLQHQAAGLRRTSVNQHKEDVEPISQKDIKKVARIWEDNGGDTRNAGKVEGICKICGCNYDLVLRSFPSSGEDFAKKLFDGAYTGDTSQMAKVQLRSNLRDGILRKMSTLQRTETREERGITDEDIAALAKVFDQNGGDLAKLAQLCGFPAEVIHKIPPKDGTDFGRKLLEGAYNTVGFEAAKSTLRSKLAGELEKAGASLKRTTTKEYSGISDEELAFVGRIYTNHRGNLDAIAAATGVTPALLKASPPLDGTDFAKRLLAGSYTTDKPEAAKNELRKRLQDQLKKGISQLRRITTKEWNGKSSDEDVELFSRIYTDYSGDLKKISTKFNLSLEVLQSELGLPVDAKDFARKLLLGKYTPDGNAMAAKDLRRSLTETLKDGSKPELRRTQTRVYEGVPEPGEIVMLAKVYKDYGGNLEKLADLFNADKNLIFRMEAYPTDANDFARKLLQGVYADGVRDDLRATLKKTLREELKRGMSSLNRTETKTYDGEPDEDAVAAVAMLWEEHFGDIDKIATVTGCNIQLLRKKPPPDSRTFGRNYLLGHYNV